MSITTTDQLNASLYFESYLNNKQDNVIPDDIDNLTLCIAKKKNTLEFITLIYDECFNAKDNIYYKHIMLSISRYVNYSNEKQIYKKSNYYIFDMGIHFIRTKEGNYRNWIYAFEIDEAYNALQLEIINLDITLEKKVSLLTTTMLIV
jgi:hypothetical protein